MIMFILPCGVAFRKSFTEWLKSNAKLNTYTHTYSHAYTLANIIVTVKCFFIGKKDITCLSSKAIQFWHLLEQMWQLTVID